MSTPIDPRGQDNPSTYFVEDRSNDAEMVRLLIQDATITEGMGGPLAEQENTSTLRHVLDIGCGPGGWILETARHYPHMELVGIDISWRMLEYARAQAQAHQLNDGVTFRVMNALRPLEFPDNSFDLVTTRLSSSFMLVKDWPRLLQEMVRVTCPGGVIRVVDADVWQSNSHAHMRLNQMQVCAGYKAGHSRVPEQWGITSILPQLLSENGCQDVKSKPYSLEYKAGTVATQNFYQNVMYFYQTLLPFLRKWECVTDDYNAIYEKAMIELQQHDFQGMWNFLVAWGKKKEREES